MPGYTQWHGINTLCSKAGLGSALCVVLLVGEESRTYHDIVKVDFLKVRIIVLDSFQSFFHIRFVRLLIRNGLVLCGFNNACR